MTLHPLVVVARKAALPLALITLVACSSGKRSTTAAAASAPGSSPRSAQVFLQGDAQPQPAVVSDPQSGAQLFVADELWLTVSAAELNGPQGTVPLSLASEGGPARVDVLGLGESSSLLAGGSYAPASYSGVTLTVTGAEMVGTNPATGQRETHPLALRTTQFEAAFSTPWAQLEPGRPATIVVDWQPSIQATTQRSGAPAYSLGPNLDAFLPGAGSRRGFATTLEGPVTRTGPDKVGVDYGGFVIPVALVATTEIPAPLVPGQPVSVQVDLPTQVGQDLTATTIEAMPTPVAGDTTPAPAPAASPPPSSAAICGDMPACPPGVDRHGDIFGDPDNLSVEGLRTNAAGYVEFSLRNVDTNEVVARVTTDQLTVYDNVSGGADLQNGMRVDVDGCICEPPTQPMEILADEVDVRGQTH